MSLPPKPKKKKKKKKAKKPDTPIDQNQEESQSETDSDIEDCDENEAIERQISKKYPEYKRALLVIDELKKQYPQTSINGEKNIWIIKPAQSSRGRGIVLIKNLIEIQEIAC